jgi:hypothetical protein
MSVPVVMVGEQTLSACTSHLWSTFTLDRMKGVQGSNRYWKRDIEQPKRRHYDVMLLTLC